ncbi:MAG: hypothetical protein HC934_01615 [Acaryochloridaceae cyanobacterium SU_2_1]|nr:hypothetical protein [Acaryochloridaceae cyanobacterium SU_2_1]
MSEINSWEYSLVGDFFAKFNWSGKEIALAAPNSGSEMLNWQLQTVQTFLGRLNWTGESVKHLEHLSALQGLSTSLAVKDFFQLFAWEGQPTIGAVPEVPTGYPTEPEDDFRLNDFSDMF